MPKAFSYLALMLLGINTCQSKGEVVLANTSSTSPVSYFSGGAADTNLWFDTNTNAQFLAIRSLKLYGEAGKTLGVTLNWNSAASAVLSGTEGAAGEYLFDLSSLALPTLGQQYILQIRSVTGTGLGLQQALNASLTAQAAGYTNFFYSAGPIRFELSTTPVPEPGTLLIGGIAAACGGGGVWWKRRRKLSIAPETGEPVTAV
jgi:hypothetical protein